MIDLKLIEDEINELKKQLRQKENEFRKAKEDNLKEQYGKDFGCNNCAYSCCVYVGDYHTNCVQGNCILCCDYCDEYMPENELSTYIRNHHYYDEYTVDRLSNLLGVSDIMHKSELHEKALEILKIRDKKEKTNEKM